MRSLLVSLLVLLVSVGIARAQQPQTNQTNPPQILPIIAPVMPIGAGTAGGGATALSITRAQIPSTTIGLNKTISVNGYNVANDLGSGAVYTSVSATSTGVGAIQDAGGTWFNLVLGGTVQPGWFGAPGDGGGSKIGAGDITANPQWRGYYAVGTSWDTVGTQEALIAAGAPSSTPYTGGIPFANVAWNTSNSAAVPPNQRFFARQAQYGINQQLVFNAAFLDIEFASRLSTAWTWNGDANNAQFTGAISGQVLTTSAVTGTIEYGQPLTGAGVTVGQRILNQVSGTPGGAGAYNVTISQTVASEAMATTPPHMFFTDSWSYGYAQNLTFIAPVTLMYASPSENACLWDMEHDHAASGLSSQQLTIVNPLFQPSLNGCGWATNITSNSTQADTITVINPLFNGADVADTCFFMGSDNGINWTFIGGDMQGCPHLGFQFDFGQAIVIGMNVENQSPGPFNIVPLLNALTTGGADFNVQNQAGVNVLNDVQDVRVEDCVLIRARSNYAIARNDSASCTPDGADTQWTASTGWQIGQVTQELTTGHLMMLVDDGSPQGVNSYGPISTSTTTSITDNTASYTPGALVGDTIILRCFFADGGARTISANTATTISWTSPTSFPCLDSYHVAGLSGSIRPADPAQGFSTLAWAQTDSTSFGVNTTANSTTVVLNAKNSVGAPVANEYLCIPGGNPVGRTFQFGVPTNGIWCEEIVSASTVSNVTTMTMRTAPPVTLTGVYAYWGVPTADGSLNWIDLDFNCITGVGEGDQLQCPLGRALNSNNITMAGNLLRPDFIRSTELPVANVLSYSTPPVTSAITTANAGATVNVSWLTSNYVTLFPSQNETVTATAPPTGLAQTAFLIVKQNGTPRTLTFTTNFSNVQPLTTTSVSGLDQILEFTSDGSGSWVQVGSVTTTGSPVIGNLAKFSGTNSLTNGDLSGDCTTTGTLATTCTKTGGFPIAEVQLGKLIGANFNSTADQTIALTGPTKFAVTRIVVTNASTSLTTAQGGVYAAASKTTPLFGLATTFAYSYLTNATLALSLGSQAATTQVQTTTCSASCNIFLSLTAGQGATATADLYVYGVALQ